MSRLLGRLAQLLKIISLEVKRGREPEAGLNGLARNPLKLVILSQLNYQDEKIDISER